MIKIITKNLYGTTLTSGEAIAAESRTFEAKLRFGNVEHSGIYSFAYTSYISPQKFTLGSTSSAMFNCETASFKSGSSSALKGQVFTAIIYVAGSNEPIGLGEFKITEATEKDGIFSITAYDKMYFVKDKPYTPTITGKRSLFNIFKDICTQIDNEGMGSGFTKTSPVSFGDTATLDTSVLSGYPLKEALGYLCAYAGRNCVVNRSGAFEARRLTAFKDYKLLNDDRIETPEIGESDLEIKSLTAVISDSDVLFSGSSEVGTLNFVCPIMTQSRLNDLYSKDFALTSNAVHTFRTGKINQLLGDPRLEVGDTIPLTHDGKTYNIPIMMIKLEFDGGLMSEIESYGLEEDSSISLAQKVDFALKKTNAEISKYAQTSSELSGVIAGGLGLYKTEIADESGAVRTYMHDKPTLEGSSYIATFNSTGFAWTVSGWNGGNPNWSDGVDTIASNMVMRTISAHKITADMIDVSELSALNATIGGFCIAGGNTASNGFRDNSISSIIKTDRNKVDSANPEYAVFLRGQSVGNDGNLHGAYKPTNVVIGVIKRTDSTKTWDESPYTFYVSASGRLKATEANITGTITATSGTIGGFCIAGNSKASNGFWDNSISSIIKTDQNIVDTENPEYAVFLRGQSVDDNGFYGAYKPTNVVFGIKKRTDSSQSWNSASYTFNVLANGKMVCRDDEEGLMLEADAGYLNVFSLINGTYQKAGSVFSTVISGFDKQKPFLCMLASQSTGAGIYITGSSGNGYIIYRNPPTSNSGVIGNIVNRFYGNVQFENTIYTLDSACAKNNFVLTSNAKYLFGTTSSGTRIRLIGMSSGNNIVVGNEDAPNNLNLYTSNTINLSANTIKANNTTLATGSDRRIKNSISCLDEKYMRFFERLEPVKFKYNDGKSGRFHLGFIAQDILSALENSGLTSMDFAGYVKTDSENEDLGGYELALRYSEFPALNTYMIQKCLSEIATLKAEIQSLKQKG